MSIHPSSRIHQESGRGCNSLRIGVQTSHLAGPRGVSRAAERSSPSSVSWFFPGASSLWDIAGTPLQGRRAGGNWAPHPCSGTLMWSRNFFKGNHAAFKNENLKRLLNVASLARVVTNLQFPLEPMQTETGWQLWRLKVRNITFKEQKLWAVSALSACDVNDWNHLWFQ